MSFWKKLFGNDVDQPADPAQARTGLNFSGLSLIKQGDCGYFVDRDHVIRAFWVSKLEIAGSKGHLTATLHLNQARGELSDIPLSVFYALDQNTFLHAENKSYGDIGGYIIMLDKHTLPVCGRARKDQ